MSNLRLTALDGEWAVARLSPDAAIPEWAVSEQLLSITRTRDELSILVPAGQVPDGVVAQFGFRALAVVGPLEFSLTGVLAVLSGALAAAGVPVFVISTYDTDIVLVPAAQLGEAVVALEASGYSVLPPAGA